MLMLMLTAVYNMSFSIFRLFSSSLIWPLLVIVNLSSAQSISNAIGMGGYAQGGPYFDSFLNASLRPAYRSSFSFTGYNLSDINPEIAPINSNSSENWSLNLNYSIVQSNENQTVSNLVYSLTFPEEELPIFNSSEWQLCAHVANIQWPGNITDLDYSNDGSCLPFFGRDCYDAVIASLSTASDNGATNCPSGPNLAGLPACSAHFGRLDYTIVSAGIMNFTEPYIWYDYNNRSYVDSETSLVVANPNFTGLRSGNPYAYHTVELVNDNPDTIRTNASKLIFSALTLTESPSARANRSLSNVLYPFSSRNNPRLVCGRALKINTVPSEAVVSKGSSFAAIFVAVMITSFMYM